MESKRQDVRVTKTQRALAYAMMKLLETSSFAKITVNDICQEALVSRSTFYAHFEDKYQLMLFCLQEMRQMLAEQLPDDMTPHELLTHTLRRVREHANVYRNIFLADPNKELMRMFRTHFASLVETVLQKEKGQQAQAAGSLEMISVYCAGGIAATMDWWIDTSFRMSAEDIAALQGQLLEAAVKLRRAL